jgi:hypothetical protein
LVAELAKSRKQRDAFEAWAHESEETLDRVLNDLTEANETKDRPAAELNAYRVKRVTMVADLNTTRVGKEHALAEKIAAIEQQKNVESRYQKLWRKYNHY